MTEPCSFLWAITLVGWLCTSNGPSGVIPLMPKTPEGMDKLFHWSKQGKDTLIPGLFHATQYAVSACPSQFKMWIWELSYYNYLKYDNSINFRYFMNLLVVVCSWELTISWVMAHAGRVTTEAISLSSKYKENWNRWCIKW